MHYPVMTEKHLADRWQVSLKTLRRWRLDGEGPVWHGFSISAESHDSPGTSSTANANALGLKPKSRAASA